MRYLGGKARLAPHIWRTLRPAWNKATCYVEPFVGSAAVLEMVPPTKPRFASDANEALITMYQHLQQGWVPPTEVSEALFHEYKAHKNPADPLTAFIGFGCSFGGNWFTSYANSGAQGDNFADIASRAVRRTIALCRDVAFSAASYEAVRYPRGAVVYMDPPYAGTAGYLAVQRKTGKFDHIKFWDFVRRLSKTSAVFVSEYTAPDDFEVAFAKTHTVAVAAKENSKFGRQEKLEYLFVHKSLNLPKETLF